MRTGWKECALIDVCTLQRGFDLPKKSRVLGPIPLMSSSGAIDFHIEARVLGPGVVTGRSGSIGKVFYTEDDFWPLNTTLYVKDFHGNYPRFVYYLLSSFDLKRFSSGAGVPTLNRNSVHNERVKIPETVDEQERIVAILDEAFAGIDAAIANTEKNLANARELFESYLDSIFGAEGETVNPVSLGDQIHLLTGFAFKSKGYTESSNSVPLLRGDNVVQDSLRWEKVKRWPANDVKTYEKYVLTRMFHKRSK